MGIALATRQPRFANITDLYHTQDSPEIVVWAESADNLLKWCFTVSATALLSPTRFAARLLEATSSVLSSCPTTRSGVWSLVAWRERIASLMTAIRPRNQRFKTSTFVRTELGRFENLDDINAATAAT